MHTEILSVSVSVCLFIWVYTCLHGNLVRSAPIYFTLKRVVEEKGNGYHENIRLIFLKICDNILGELVSVIGKKHLFPNNFFLVRTL